MKNKNAVLKNMSKGLTAKIWINKKGWSKQEFLSACEAFIACGNDISFHNFLSAYKV